MKLITTSVVTVLLSLSLNLHAQDADAKLSDFKFSETVLGTKPSEAHLKDKVVVIEYWGVN